MTELLQTLPVLSTVEILSPYLTPKRAEALESTTVEILSLYLTRCTHRRLRFIYNSRNFKSLFDHGIVGFIKSLIYNSRNFKSLFDPNTNINKNKNNNNPYNDETTGIYIGVICQRTYPPLRREYM